MAQKRLEAFHHLLAVREVTLFIHPASWPLFEVWAISCKLICGRSPGYWGGVRCGFCFGFCAHAADHPPQPLPALSRLRLREGAALPGKQHHRDSRPASPRLEARMFRLPQARRRLRSTQHPPFRIRPGGFMVLLLYRMRRVDRRACGVRVEELPWAIGKHQLTKAYMLFWPTGPASCPGRKPPLHSAALGTKSARRLSMWWSGGWSIAIWAPSRRSASMRSSTPRGTSI